MPAALAIIGASGMAFCQWLIYVYAPIESTMGIIQKIFYLHLPLAWWALFSFFLVFCGSIAFILKRTQTIDNFCGACAEIGLLFSGLALITGMIWAKKSWGVWWTWDPRLSTTLVMWFVYAAYLILRQLDMPDGRKGLICAILGIVAFLDVPLVFLSARIFRSIHPAVFATKGGGLELEMLLALIGCILFMGLIWLALVLIRTRQSNMLGRLNALLFEISGEER